MPLSSRRRGWIIGLVLVGVMITFLLYPFILANTPFAALFYNMELAVVVILFGSMLFILGLVLYLGN
ncbi:MAG: hypothetical protein ACFFD8_08260 [Candidatus Thorarchaeota archaeon]